MKTETYEIDREDLMPALVFPTEELSKYFNNWYSLQNNNLNERINRIIRESRYVSASYPPETPQAAKLDWQRRWQMPWPIKRIHLFKEMPPFPAPGFIARSLHWRTVIY